MFIVYEYDCEVWTSNNTIWFVHDNENDLIVKIRLVKEAIYIYTLELIWIELSAKFSKYSLTILPICRQAARRDNVKMHFVRHERSHSAARHSQSMDTATSMGPFDYPQLRLLGFHLKYMGYFKEKCLRSVFKLARYVYFELIRHIMDTQKSLYSADKN